MKNVLLVGDSIRLMYQSRVAELLGDGVRVFAPDENCRYTKYALWGMYSWYEGWGCPEIDVIHWNTGIWDLHRCTADGMIFTPLDEYLEYNRRLAIQMESYCKNLIWATITPGGRQLDEKKKTNYSLKEGDTRVYLCDYTDVWNGDVRRYNAACSELLSRRGIRIDDLYGVISADPDRFISEDGIHPSPDGVEALSQKVASEIKKLL